MKEMVITASMAKTAPDYRKTANFVLMACREFYRQPENEKAYLMQKKGVQDGSDNCRLCVG